MFELLGVVFGGILRMVPELFNLWKAKSEQDHEFRMMEWQLKADAARATAEYQRMELQGNIQQNLADMQALMEVSKAQATPTGIPWVDAINALVRPFLTFWYCVVAYGTYRACVLYTMLAQDIPFATAVADAWTPQDTAIVMSIIGFWFVDRAIRKHDERK